MHRLVFILISIEVLRIDGIWPSSNQSHIQLLGLFKDPWNTSDQTALSTQARAMFKSAILLSQEYHLTIQGQYLQWQTSVTDGDVINALDKTCSAISTTNIVGIVGPELSREAHFVAPFAEKIGLPVISHMATDPDLSNRNAYRTFYRTVPSDTAATLSIAQLFLRFNWTSCIVIYQNDQFGSGGTKALSHVFRNNGLAVTTFVEFDISTNRIRGNLRNQLITSSTRIVVVWAESSYTYEIIRNALDDDVLGPQFTWILSQSISLDLFNQSAYPNLIGMLTIEPTIGAIVDSPINTTLLNAAYALWRRYEPESFPGVGEVNYYALFAFDATWTLIQSLTELCSNVTCVSLVGSSYCFDRQLLNSNQLIDMISRQSFLGVSGLIEFASNVTDRVHGSYYIVQNVQPTTNGLDYVPILQRSDPGEWKVYTRTNVILWPGNTLIPPTGRAVLQGVRLRIGVIEATPFTTVTTIVDQNGETTTKLIGYVPDLIALLQGRMNFIPEIIVAPLNQTYSGLVRDVANGVYDIVIADVTVTSARREIVGFSNAIFDNSMRIIVRKESSSDVDLLSYLKPFSFTLWMMLLAACLYAAVLISILERQANEALQHRSMVSSAAMSTWYSIGTLMGYGADFHATTASGRLVTTGLYLLSLVFVATYTANLASDLTVSKSKNIISGVDDLKNGKIPFNRFGIRLGTAGEDYFIREISGGNRNFYPLKTRKDLYDKLLNKVIDGSFMDTGIAEYITNNVYCNLTLAGVDFDKSAFGIVIPKQWLYGQDLDVHILSLRETGVLEEMKRKWFQGGICSSVTEESTGMSFETMGGLFLTFAVICTLAIFMFIYEKREIIKDYLWRRMGRKRSPLPTVMHMDSITKEETLN